jgi:hypothetical protein
MFNNKKNKSSLYGFYGGVSNANHYVPGSPLPPNNQWSLSQELKNFVVQNAANIVLRQTVSSEPGNVDTFVLSTSGKPEDIIVYQSNQDTVVLDNIAGSGITSDTNEPVDGGTF